MNFKELCATRYSCRQYKSAPIPEETLDYIRECVRLAPSAVNLQPWRFLLITDAERLAQVKSCYKREWIETAPAIVICCTRRDEAWTRRCDQHNHSDIDIAIATEHLCLAASEQGLGNCWVCNFDVDKLNQTGIVPEGYEAAVLVPLGYAADQATEKKRKPMEEVWG
ncbi:MAG: nitroreductase family protein [Bacteroidaceae bacterium]|nr:nitroreductase family protein [Bacteroidaceae bacterium]